MCVWEYKSDVEDKDKGDEDMVVVVVVAAGMLEKFLLTDESEETDDDGGVMVDDDEILVTSTGFLERFLPLCMCLSQYLESGYASFEHLHFFPSVLLHLPGSGSAFLP